MISGNVRGSTYAILSGFLYSFIGYFGVSAIHSSLSVSNMLFWRFLISSMVIGIFIIVRPTQNTPSFKEIFTAFFNGAIFYALSTILYFVACLYIGSGLSMVLFFTYPAMIILLNYFLYRHHIPPIYYAAMLLILAGMPLFIDTNEFKFDLLGVILSIISALLYAAYIISSKKISSFCPKLSTLMVCLGCTATCFIAALAEGSFSVPSGGTVWAHLFGISILSTSIPILLLLYSLNYISAEKASMLSVLEPVFVLIFGVTLLGEPMRLQYVLGAVIVLSGALLTLFGQQASLEEDNTIVSME